jgi:predicted O-methyltransferase YrrM
MSDLKELIKNSNSTTIVSNISKNMEGKTFHHHYHILHDIRTLLGPGKKVYTEIGTYCGGSAMLMANHDYETEINCIDPLHVLPNQETILNNNINKFNKNNYTINVNKKFSTDVTFIEELKKNNFKTDILFIDGGHSYTDVFNDFNNYAEFVNDNGYIIFDDYLDYKWSPDVKIAVDDIMKYINLNKFEIIGTIPNYQNSFCNSDNKLEFLNEFVIRKKPTDDIKFVIVMATFCRPNGKTPSYLRRSLDSVINQTFKNWDIIIVADKYEPKEELESIIEEYRKKTNNNIIYLYNNIVERDYITNKLNLWNCAGAGSINMGLNYARTHNYKYYCHLDDDDFWTKEHLQQLNKIYSLYDKCIFINTKSTYCGNYLPLENMEIYANNRLPLPYQTVHSSFSFRLDIIKDNYFTTLDKNGSNNPSDLIMLNTIKNFLENNRQYCSIYIPVLTCYHDEEGILR